MCSIISVDQVTGAVQVGDDLRLGCKLRYVVRDKSGAVEDL